jgi:hypothetical protein
MFTDLVQESSENDQRFYLQKIKKEQTLRALH